MQFELVIFDCDGVLVDSEPLAAEAMKRVYARRGMVLEPENIAAGVGMKQADILSLIGNATGHYLPDEALSELWPETRLVFGERLQPTPGVVDFLTRLDLPACVASSSTMERIAFSLSVTGLDRFFGEALFSSTMVARGKPAPDLFLHAAASMGADPSRCLVIEDSPYGVEGAKAAGMHVFGFAGGGHASAEMIERLAAAEPHAICKSWSQVEGALAAR